RPRLAHAHHAMDRHWGAMPGWPPPGGRPQAWRPGRAHRNPLGPPHHRATPAGHWGGAVAGGTVPTRAGGLPLPIPPPGGFRCPGRPPPAAGPRPGRPGGPTATPWAPLTIGPRPPGIGGWQWQEETSRPETGGSLSPSARLEAFDAPCHTSPRHSVEYGKYLWL